MQMEICIYGLHFKGVLHFQGGILMLDSCVKFSSCVNVMLKYIAYVYIHCFENDAYYFFAPTYFFPFVKTRKTCIYWVYRNEIPW